MSPSPETPPATEQTTPHPTGHPSVSEVAVVGCPDPEGIRGEVVEAFIVLRSGLIGDDALETELKHLVRDQCSKHAYPRIVHFVDSLPKTPSGKIQRFVLRGEARK